jgi:hypothetical protein
MKRNWKDIKWMFESNGADIYVQEVSIDDWRKIISLINEKYKVKYGVANQINENETIDYLTDETGEIESKSVSIYLGEIQLNCHFFLDDQIEFDIDPKEINSIQDYESIEDFMINVSKTIDKQVTLTWENDVKFPLVKIDINRGVNRILTEKEAKKFWGNPNSFISKMKLFKAKMEMKFTPNRFKVKILNSANEPYKSTKKDENVW